MRGNWATWSIKHKQVIYFFAVLLTVMGIFSYFTLGRQEDPDFAVKQMVISAAWPGATAKQMEMQVTDKIEKIAQTVPDVDYITSYSRPGVCVVNVFLKETLSTAESKLRWQEVRNLVSDGKTHCPPGCMVPITMIILTMYSAMCTPLLQTAIPMRICAKKPALSRINLF